MMTDMNIIVVTDMIIVATERGGWSGHYIACTALFTLADLTESITDILAT